VPEYAIAGRVVARSPIPPTPPVIEADGWTVSGRRSDAPLTIADWTPLAKVLLRVAPAPSRRDELVRYGSAAHRDWDGVGVLLVGWGPDEWLALGPPGSQATLVERLRRTDGTVVDVTNAGALLRVTGDRARDLLARECALDLSDRTTPDGAAPNGSVRRTAVSHVAAGLIRDDIDDTLSYLVHCEWSLGRYLYDSLLDAGNEWGIETDGFHGAPTHWAAGNARER
jgi:heterotetrameric sarcosine oxidase gamma subunit